MLDHLVQDCIKKSEIESFPYKLFARTFEEFLQQNESVLVPLLLWHYNCEVTIIEKLCRALKKKGRQLFRYFLFSIHNSVSSDMEFQQQWFNQGQLQEYRLTKYSNFL